MSTLSTPQPGHEGSEVPSLIAASLRGRRRRPSGEPPPLPRRIDHSIRWYLLLAVVTAALWAAMSVPAALGVITQGDLAVLRTVATARTAWLTHALLAVNTALTSPWTVRLVILGTIAVLVAFRRFQHLAAYLVIVLAEALLMSAVTLEIGRMRPSGLPVLGPWQGYSQPSRPVAVLTLALVGVLYTLVPAGRRRNQGKWVAALIAAALCTARLYLAIDHPTDQLTALIVAWPLAVVVFWLMVPNDVFPISYRGGRKAHLDIGGRRGAAIVTALDHQLGLAVTGAEPFGLEASAGSTPLRLQVRGPDGARTVLFGKLYALNHLRSDRWYKRVRAVVYGRLEDEKPFSTVRRLVEYEDHLLRLMRDAGLPTPRPYGFVEMTPEREYLIVMEFFEGSQEIRDAPVDDRVIDDALRVVRRMWDTGLAHRDIKPSNILVRDGRALLIDVAFAAVRPTPWRQAVDLANMMLTLALASTPDHVYERALHVFAADDVAEAFAACRSITVPSQLRSLIRADGRDLIGRFRRLAPDRRPVPVQLWDFRRVAITGGLLAMIAATVALCGIYLEVTGLL
ncbi:MAG TPA: RIO1 family regulatory kinase/ATPase [Streptosporangiaceae bacterium]|nr:RIO1 family regulatory kinase/ATPase [Streptosporangiaceae bacterium]